MKKLLLILALATGLTFNSNSQVLNGGFESWNAGLPNNWWGLVLPPYNVFSQSTNAHSGSFAVNLHVDSIGGNPFTSPLASGDGNNVTTHPLTFVPGSLSFWYRLNAVGGDEVTATAVIYSGVASVGVVVSVFPATANYTLATAPVMYGGSAPATADSIAIIFTITNTSGSAHIGTDLLIDDVSVSISSSITSPQLKAFTIAPVPANEAVTIAANGNASLSDIVIVDVSGRVVYSSENTVSSFVFETSNLDPGLYICAAKAEGVLVRKSFVVNH